MKTIMIAALAAGGFLVASSAVANADAQVEGSYATIEGCQADGAGGQFNDGGAYANYYCQQGDDGLYYLFLTN
jgi:hypothetical protein